MSTNNYCSDTMRITRLTIIKWLQQVISDVSSVLAQNMAPMRHRTLSDHCLLGFLYSSTTILGTATYVVHMSELNEWVSTLTSFFTQTSLKHMISQKEHIAK